jgi:hypothetical protein
MNVPQKAIRRMGFVRDQQGIMNRYLRESEHWKAHLEKTRAFINHSFAGKSYESLAVLGSGWLLDVPLDQLASKFRRILLVDICHPAQIRKKIEKLDHVELVEADLTGGAIGQVWRFTRNKGPLHLDNLLEGLHLHPPELPFKPDALVSVNLLNQLDIILCEFLEKHRFHPSEPMDRFRSRIQTFHVDWLVQTPGCLVSDTVETGTAPDGKTATRSLLYTHLPEGFRKECWSWEFDTQGTYRSEMRIEMEVRAVEWA